SPTRASVSPASSVKLTPDTAETRRPSMGKAVVRRSTSRRAIVGLPVGRCRVRVRLSVVESPGSSRQPARLAEHFLALPTELENDRKIRCNQRFFHLDTRRTGRLECAQFLFPSEPPSFPRARYTMDDTVNRL